MCKFNTKCSSLLIVLFLALPLFAQNNNVAQRPFGQQTVSFSATPTFDASKSDAFKITLTGNVTSSTLTGLEPGMSVTLDIYQDGTGGRTFSPPGIITGWVAILSAANAQTTEICYYDGTNCNVYTTTTSGGGGSGTVNSGTANHITYYAATGTTVSSDANLDDGATNANGLTYSGTAGIYAQTYNATGSGAMTFIGNESTCSGAASGKDVLCAGDSTSHSIETSLNGGSFFPVPQWNSTSPVPFGVVVAGTFPQHTALPRGSQGQPLCEGPAAGNPGWCQLDLSVSANVINRLAKANQTASTVYNDQVNTFTSAGTLDLSASTVPSALRAPNGAGITTAVNGGMGYDTTSNNMHFGINSADARVPVLTGSTPVNHNCVWWVVTSGHVELGDSGTAGCPTGSTPRLDQILSATNAWTTTNGDNPLSLQFAQTTAGRTSVEFTESSASTSTGTPFLLNVHTLASSNANPFRATARGTSNGVTVDSITGTLSALGTANINATEISGVPIPSNGSSTAGRIPITDGSGNAAWGDPIISQAYVNIWTAQDVTVTRTSAAVRNPVFSQTGTLQMTWAGITGSPATCTLQIQGVDSQGNALNDGSTVSVSPANGTTSQQFNATAGLLTAAQVKAIFACGTYPTAGTLTLDFTPYHTVTAANLPAAVDTNSGNKSASTLRVVLATDQPQLTNKLLVTPDALPANQSVNVNQIGGSAVSTAATGVQKVGITGNSGAAMDAAGQNASSPANELLTGCQFNTSPTTITSGNVSPSQCDSGGKLLVNPGTVTIASNSSVNVNQIAGNAVSTSASGTQKVGVVGSAGAAVDQAPGSAVPANAVMEGLSDGTNTRFALSDSSGRQLVRNYPDTTTTSYHASASFAGSSTTDNSVFPGNATNTALLTKITVTCTQTTAGTVTLTLIKRSAADTSGTSAAMTKVPDDSNYAAAVSAPLSYTGTGPSVGAAVGNLDVAQFGCNASATAGPNDVYVFKPAKPIVLRGTAQQVAVNMGNAAITGGTLTVTYEWIETTTP